MDEPDAQDAAYARYCAKKDRLGLPARDQPGWQEARDRWATNSRRGDAFRDLTASAMAARGFGPAQGWQVEIRLRAVGQSRRTHDIGRPGQDDGTGLETKVGGGGRDATLGQLERDVEAARAGRHRVWVYADLGQLKDATVRRRLETAQRKLPHHFAVVDCSDPRSTASFAEHFPQRAQMAEAFGEAGLAFKHYEREHAAARGQGRELSVQDAWTSWGRARQAQRLAQISFKEPPTQVGRRPSLVDRHTAGVRTTPIAEVDRRRRQASGRSNEPLHHHRPTGPTRPER